MELDTSSPQGRLVLGILSSVAEFERNLIKERQAEGIAAAKAKGKQFGRPRTQQDKKEAVTALVRNGRTKQSIADELSIGLSTVYKILKDHREAQKKNAG